MNPQDNPVELIAATGDIYNVCDASTGRTLATSTLRDIDDDCYYFQNGNSYVIDDVTLERVNSLG